MNVQTHSTDNCRSPRRNRDLDPIAGVASGILFGAVICGLLFYGYSIVSTAMSKPENPIRMVAEEFMAAIAGEVR